MNPREHVKQVLGELLQRMTVPFEEIRVEESELPGYDRFVIVTPDTGVLIGRSGEHLQALSLLVRKISAFDDEEHNKVDYQFFIDVGDYQVNKIRETQRIARTMAERAKSFDRSVELEPMSAYDRMIVHSTLAPVSGVRTESEGSGKFRRVVIHIDKMPAEFEENF